MRPPKGKLLLLAGLALLVVGVFLLGDMGTHWRYILSRRVIQVAAMLVSAVAIGVSTVAFQTITRNRILTPSVVGLDSLYLFLQTLTVFIGGRVLHVATDARLNFAVSLAALLLFALFLHRWLFGRRVQDIYRLLLVGMIFGTFWGSMATFMQVLIDPNEFLQLQGRMFASPNRVNADLVAPAAAVVALLLADLLRSHRHLDVVALGQETALSLGVDFQRRVRRWLLDISALTAVATALIGPMTFLGLVAANLGYQILKSWRHSTLLSGVGLISVVIVVGGQWAVERVADFTAPLSVMIHLVGGFYFLFLLTRERVIW